MRVLKEVERCFHAIRTKNGHLNAFVSVRNETELFAEAKDSAARHDENRTISPVDGLLVGVKDNICTDQLPTTCASNMLKEYKSPFEATVVSTLKNMGALVIGKTNMDEFGMGSHSTNSAFGPVRREPTHPEDSATRSAGGSSGGSAAAVAASMCHVSLGTDTGGSIRMPAAYSGVVGFKPSYGMISRHGVIAYANSLDTVGVISKDIKSARTVFNVISHPDPNDPTCLTQETRRKIYDLARLLDTERKARPLRIGVAEEYRVKDLHPPQREAWRRAIDKLENMGNSIHSVSLPSTTKAVQAYYIIAPAEASSNLARFDGVRYGERAEEDWPTEKDLFSDTRQAGLGEEVRRRILLGNFTLSASAKDNYFLKAQAVRRQMKEEFSNNFAFPDAMRQEINELSATFPRMTDNKLVDVIITPTTLSPAPELEHVLDGLSPTDTFINDIMTVPASLAGIPAVSVPVKVGKEIVGVQIMGQFGDEETVLKVGEMLESL